MLMTSDAQASANRRNAEKSTGPRTEAGKARSSMNALRYGGYVEDDSPIVTTILGEDPYVMEQLREDLVHELDPASRVEEIQAISRILVDVETDTKSLADAPRVCIQNTGVSADVNRFLYIDAELQ